MNTLFSPLQLGALHLQNRIVMAPMTRNRADADGCANALMAQYYGQRGDAGLVIAEGWIERAGRSTCFAEGRLLNAAGDVIAKASSTIRLIPTDAVQATTRRAME